MKKALVPIFVFLISTGSQCIPAKESDIVQACKLYESLAEVIMEARQKGAPMSGLYTRDYGTKERNEITKKIIIEAYDIPRFNSDQSKKDAVRNFKNDKFLFCIKNAK